MLPPDLEQLNELAKAADSIDHKENIREALRHHPKALFWALMVSMCVIMEGYDTILLGNFYAYPEFAKQFGKYNPATKNNQVSAPWQAGLGNSSGVGAFFGALLNGFLVDRFGQKRTILGALVCLTGFLFIVFFSKQPGQLLAGEFLCGFPWGIFATTSPAYASEVLPLSLRVYLTSWTNMCFIIGQFIAAGVLAGLVDVPNQWSYRVPFAIQWFWPCVLFPILLFAPESPWYLVRKKRFEEARHSLRRLHSVDEQQLEAILSLIVHTDNQEQQLKTETSYWQCFRGPELRRTEIASMAFAGQVTTGLMFAYNSTYFFQQVGLGKNQIYRINLGGTALALVGTFISWFALMPYFGRRIIYLWGSAAMTITLLVIGILQVRTHTHTVALTQAALTLLWTFLFQLSVGQLGWALPAEMGSTRLRQKTVVIARNAYYVASVIAAALEPYFLNPTAWNLRGYTSFVWAGTCFVTLVWAFFRLPESKGRSYEEMNLLFAKGVPARHFKNYEVDVFDTSPVDDKAAVVQIEHAENVHV